MSKDIEKAYRWAIKENYRAFYQNKITQQELNQNELQLLKNAKIDGYDIEAMLRRL